MTTEEKEALKLELETLQNTVKFSEFINPKTLRRIEEIQSLLFTNGKTGDYKLTLKKGKQSNRVTALFENSRRKR